MPSLHELIMVRNELEAQIAATRAEERAGVIEHVQELVALYGLKQSEVFGPVRKTARSVPKYRDPSTGKTWTGRGRAPAWFDESRAADLQVAA